MARRSGVVSVDGAKELARAFRALGKDVPKEVRRETKDLIERVIVPKARARGRQVRTNLAGRPTTLGSRGVASIRPEVRGTRLAVVMGGARVPYAHGHEWGARRYRQFPPSNKQGYILYPTVHEESRAFAEQYASLLQSLADRYVKGA